MTRPLRLAVARRARELARAGRLVLAVALLATGCASTPPSKVTDADVGLFIGIVQADALRERGGSMAGELERLAAEAAAQAEAGALEAAPLPPAVTLMRGTPVYYRAQGFGPRLQAASSGPPSPWEIPGATWNGALLLSAPGVREATCSWSGAPCPAPSTREIAAQHGTSAWRWDCLARNYRVDIDCGDASIKAAFRAAFGRDPESWIHQDGLAALASCGGVVPGCLGGPGCPGLRPTAPPVPDSCAPPPPPPPPCGDGICAEPETHETCPADCFPLPADPPVVTLRRVTCEGQRWVLEGIFGGGEPWTMAVDSGGTGTFVGEGKAVFAFSPTEPCPAPPPPCPSCPQSPPCPDCPAPPPPCDPGPEPEPPAPPVPAHRWTLPGAVELTASEPHLAVRVPARGTLTALRISYRLEIPPLPELSGCRYQAHSVQVDGTGAGGIPGWLFINCQGVTWTFRANSARAEKPWQTASRVTATGVPRPSGGVYWITQEWRDGEGTKLAVQDARGTDLAVLRSALPAGVLPVARYVEIDLGYPPSSVAGNPAEVHSLGWRYSELTAEWEVAP